MSDETKNDLPVETEGMVDTAIDAIADLALGQAVPAPIRKGSVTSANPLRGAFSITLLCLLWRH